MKPLNIKVTIFNNRTGELWDVTEVCHSVRISTAIWGTPGKAEFKLIIKGNFTVYEGNVVDIVVDDYNMFHGFVFRKSSDQRIEEVSVLCYDSIRYLANHGFYQAITEPLTATFSKICKMLDLKYEVVSTSTGSIEQKLSYDKAYSQIIQDRIDRQMAYHNEIFFLHCKGEVIQLMQPKDAYKNYALGQEHGILDFQYESSIDQKTYNEIVLYQDNKNTNKRISRYSTDENAIKAWGRLRLYKAVEETLTEQEIELRAKQMLEVYNKPTRSIHLNCIGQPDMFAGCLVDIKKLQLQDMIYNKTMLVESCTHEIDGNVHTMALSARIEERD